MVDRKIGVAEVKDLRGSGVLMDRKGKFTLPEPAPDNYEIYQAIMAKCLVVRAECMYIDRTVQFMALCSEFDPINVGDRVPEYQWLVNSETADSAGFRVVPVKVA